ncbi:MAG TPA: alpha/beta hydrolase [Ktedonobacteraceae bacterium]|nr:alpha/beta hydrolase [Ktedonobacteraceae bacterium]
MLTEPARDNFVTANGLRFHYVQWGEQGPPVVCLHGTTVNAFSFQAVADGLATDHRVYAYDLRGRGDSAKPTTGYSAPLHAADLAALLDAFGLARPVIIGHSLGAFVALYFAAHYPDRVSKLVLIDAGAPVPWSRPQDQPAWLTAAFNRLGTPVPSFDEYIERLKAAPFIGPYWNEYFALSYRHDLLVNADGSVVAKTYREAPLEDMRRYNEGRPEDQWAKVQVPTLLMRAGQGLFSDTDHLMPEVAAEEARRTIKRCTFINYPTLNHYTIILNVEPGPVADIRAFIDKENKS